jgi:ABC-2 type transport system permease protein
MSIFLRTRLRSASALLLPRIAMAAAAVGGSYLAGTAIAWYETAVLIGGVTVGGMIAGALLGIVYLGFVVTVVAAVGARLRSVLGTVGTTVVLLLIMPIVALVRSIGHWMPSHLVGAQVDLITGGDLTDYLPAAGVTVVAGAALVAAAILGVRRREL